MRMKAPEKHGFDAARLNRLDGFLKDRYLDTGKLPHAQVLVSRDGEIVHFSSQGAAREGSAKPIDEGSIFRIASMTKPITSVAFMMLVEDGKVAVDTPVHDILPEFKDVGVYSGGGAGVPFMTRRRPSRCACWTCCATPRA
jgi:CubicO group peptidase (beta-lactamase class C family)